MIVIGFRIIAQFGMDGQILNVALMINLVQVVYAGKMFVHTALPRWLDAALICKVEFKVILLESILKIVTIAMEWKFEEITINNFMFTAVVEEVVLFMETGKLLIENGIQLNSLKPS